MKKSRIITITYIAMVLIIVLAALLNIMSGAVNISATEVINILLGNIHEGVNYSIVHDIRLPRIIAAIFLGGALSLSGFLLQTFFQNPIAGPYVLGISSGAKLFVALFMIMMLGGGKNVSSAGMIISAFLGSLLTTGFVLIMSTKTRNISTLIICGILIGYICSAITDLLVTFADDSNIVNLHNWSMGSLSGMDWDKVISMMVIISITFVVCFVLSKPIGAFLMGEEYADGMGVNVKVLRVTIIILSSVLSATVTAFAGPISFVGIAVPHLVKSITKTSRPLIHIPACFLGGAIVVLVCDGIARELFAPTEISIGSVTAVFLVPVVIWMMLKRQGGRNE